MLEQFNRIATTNRITRNDSSGQIGQKSQIVEGTEVENLPSRFAMLCEQAYITMAL